MRTPKPTPAPGSAAEAPDVNIWLTSLGAWVHAQAEGNKVFEALVRDGLHLQRQTQSMAEASLSQATEQLAALTQRASTVHPTQVVDGLSSLFDTRVAKALERLGLPDAAAWQAMQARLAELEAQLAALRALVEVPVAARATKSAKSAKTAKSAKSAKAARAPSAPSSSSAQPSAARPRPAKPGAAGTARQAGNVGPANKRRAAPRRATQAVR